MTSIGFDTTSNLDFVEIGEMRFARETIAKPEDLEKLAPYISDLAARAAEPNILLQAPIAAATWRHLLSRFSWAKAVIYWAPSVSGKPDRLVGFFPLVHDVTRWAGLPVIEGFSNAMSFLATPLIDREYGLRVLAAFLKDQKRHSLFPTALRFNKVPADGPFHKMFVRAAQDAGWCMRGFGRHQRAILCAAKSGNDVVAGCLGKKKRKEIARLRRRLEEKGTLRFEVVSEAYQIPTALEDFAELEAGGWKGAAGTAVLSKGRWMAYFSEAVRGMAKSGRCEIVKLLLDDKLLGAAIVLISGRRAWYYKTAYNEDYASFSPGVLLTIELTKYLCGRPDIDTADSCAVQSHPMIDHIWRERMAVMDLYAVPFSIPAVGRVLIAFEGARRFVRAGAKAIFYGVCRALKL